MAEEPAPEASEVEAAAYSERLLAFTLDFFLVALPVGTIGVWLAPRRGGGSGELATGLAFLAAFVAYHAAFTSYQGRTLGKMLAGIQVVTLQGETPAPLWGIIRAVACLLTGLTLGLGFAAVFFTDHRRAIHDYLAGTCVVSVRKKGPIEAWAVFLAGWLLPALIGVNAFYRAAVPRAAAEAEIVEAAKGTLMILGALEEKQKAATGRYSDDVNELARGAQSPQDLLNALPTVLAAGSLKIRLTQDGYEISARAKDPRASPVRYLWPPPPPPQKR